jgi:hypothetical protein
MMNGFASLHVVSSLMAGFPHPWFISGGWAIDLFLNQVTRPHSDVEIGLLRNHQQALQTQFAGWRLTKNDFLRPEGAARVPWDNDDWVAAPLFQVQAWRPEDEEPAYDFFLNDSVEGAWQFRHVPSITRPVEEMSMRSPDGIPFLVPEIQLAFKGKGQRPKDEHDFTHVLPHLSEAQRVWLARTLKAAYGTHSWIARLDAC